MRAETGSRTGAIFAAIKRLQGQEGSLSVSEMCRLSGVSRSGYYTWLEAAGRRDRLEASDRKDLEEILKVLSVPGAPKGAESIHRVLAEASPPVVMNVKKIRRLMKKYGLVIPVPPRNPYDCLLSDLGSGRASIGGVIHQGSRKYGPGVVLLLHAVRIPYEGGTAYLASVVDLFTKQVLSYRIEQNRTKPAVKRTLEWLVEHHSIPPGSPIIVRHTADSYGYGTIRQITSDSGQCRTLLRAAESLDSYRDGLYGEMNSKCAALAGCDEFDTVNSIVNDYIYKHNNKIVRWELANLAPNKYYDYCISGIYTP